MFIQAFLYDKVVDSLVDTGATISVLHSKIYLGMSEDKRPILDKNCGELYMADGETVTQLGMGIFPLKIGGKVRKCRMIVADIEVPAVLGYDFLRENDCVMYVGNGTITFNGERVPCYLDSQNSKTMFHLVVL